MKKTLLLFVVLLANAALVFGQSSLQIIDKNGLVVEEGTRIVLRDTNSNAFIGSDFYKIKNIGNHDVSVRVKREILQEVDSTTNDMCFGQCFSHTISESPAPGFKVSPGQMTTDEQLFSAHYLSSGHEGITLVKYIFYDNNNPSDKVYFLMDFYAGPNVGIADVDKTAKLAAYPNPATTMLKIDYVAEKMPNGAQLVMYNIAGQKVFSQTIEDASSTVNVSVVDFPKGVYMYRIEANGYQTASKKVVVQ